MGHLGTRGQVSKVLRVMFHSDEKIKKNSVMGTLSKRFLRRGSGNFVSRFSTI